MRLTHATAEQLSSLMLANLFREYPNKLSVVLQGDGDLRPPRAWSPAFYGCFDWHSAVHSHFALVRILRQFDAAPWAGAIARALDRTFREGNIEGELRTLMAHPTFELPYGLAWLVTLDAELGRSTDDRFTLWRRALAPLVALAGERMMAWARHLTIPVRTGEHNQTAFSLGLLLDWALETSGSSPRGDAGTDAAAADIEAIRAKAAALFLDDPRANLQLEPSAHDFLSPALAQADLLRRVLSPEPFSRWLSRFLPDPCELSPVTPVDRSDGKLVHFDGLNLSRGWMLRDIALALPDTDERRTRLLSLADDHERAGLGGVSGEHYAGSHWLGTFAVVCLSGGIVPRDPAIA